mmetsp:Transcript_90215/g.289354  ORF Transcript_90215/g.289354 Transcript_90215/m.289354 type:complete len:312 (+) Transcript_90215:68-1003(+)
MVGRSDLTTPLAHEEEKHRSARTPLGLSAAALLPLVFASGLLMGSVVSVAVVMGVSAQRTDALPTVLAAAALAALEPYPMVSPPMEVPVEYTAAKPLDNACLIKKLAIPEGPQTFDACGFVVRSTDEVWNLRGDVDAAIEKYFHEDYLNAGSWGKRAIGKKALREGVLAEMRAFPDIQIHITDCVCKGNDNDGYKCAMPDVLDGTNLGPSAYGPATGRYARWTGMVESFIQKNAATGQWQYIAEWGVHDEWALIQQLGLDFRRVPHPARNEEPLHDCSPLLQMGPGPVIDKLDLNRLTEHEDGEAKFLSRR